MPFFHPNEDCDYDEEIRYVWFDPASMSVPGTGMNGNGIRHNGVPFSDVDQVFGTLELNY
ncbi:MAG: hypothetical protein GWN87_20470, partial [Desulfuromonadales bacterium]|nr:hypothetical protein [Desulfuromonadales bacterium]